MKIIRFVLFALAISFTVLQANAQRVRLIDGSLDALKGVKKMNLQFDYSKMGVGKFATEEEYLAKKKEDYNKKEEGKGDSWVKSWVADRKNRFEPQFKELFAKYDEALLLGDYSNEKYTLIFKTTFTEPGYNIYITRKNAEIDGEVWIVETANPSNIVAKISVQNCPGRTFGGNDYDTGERIQESYATAGKGLGKFLDKELN
jgi:hypothetical protein